MRRISCIFAVIILLFCISFTVSAATAPSLDATAVMATDGNCQVNMSLTLQVGSSEKIYYPLPAGATGVRVNGARASTVNEGDIVSIDLRRHLGGASGSITVNIQYTLHDLVRETSYGTLELKVPLLSGFAYPIEKFAFSVILPGQPNSRPAFSSGYHQAAIEQHLTYEIEGTAIRGSNLKDMKDHETLVMTLPVEKAMFPNAETSPTTGRVARVGMTVCGILALAYWLLTLRFIPRRQRNSEVPQGINAGQVGCLLGSSGVDLTMMVFTWAELGYLVIAPKREQVTLHKRMEMGNERSEFEQRAFRNLFGSRQTVDTTGLRYTNLSIELDAKHGGLQEMFHSRTGNPRIFRGLWAVFGMFAGGGIGAFLGDGAVLQGLLIFLLGLLGLLSGYLIPLWTDNGLFRHRRQVLTGLGIAAFWLLMGMFSGAKDIGMMMAFTLLGAGLLYGWSGRRTALGKATAGQLLGLRRYLRGRDKKQLAYAKSMDPDYFFRMAPYAIALGVGRSFAGTMGRTAPEGGCPYLILPKEKTMNPRQWNALLERTADLMDRRKQNRSLEKVIGTVRRIIGR